MHIAFVLEQSLGHTTHAQNLRRAVADFADITPTFIELPYAGMTAPWVKLPLVRSNWSVRASLAAYLALYRRIKSFDAAFFHTQVTALFSANLMRRLPSVVSLDATPLQYDRMGALYGHAADEGGRIGLIKKGMNVRAFAAATHLVAWSQWAKDGLREYDVAAEKVTVIPPGIDLKQWDFPDRKVSGDGIHHLLFVGGDWERKGGKTLLAAWERLPATLHAHLDIVTKAEGIGEKGSRLTIHRGLTPNSEPLRSLFAQADIFIFPTQGDCLPLAILEAQAAGLPIVTTDVGALPEAVRDGVTGTIIPVNDVTVLADTIVKMLGDESGRRRMAAAARANADLHFDAAKNYRRLVELIREKAAADGQ